MDVHWLEQTEGDVPAGNDWLSASEALRQSEMRFAKRLTDWRLGRWTAKRAVAVYLNLPALLRALADIEIRPAMSGAPEIFLVGKLAPVTISLSHRAGRAACAVAPLGSALGCDLEMIEPRSDTFVADYFTAEEQALVAQARIEDRPRLVALVWSGKESVLKALRAGLRLDTRSVMLDPVDGLLSCGEDYDLHAEDPGDPTVAARLSCDSNNWLPLRVRYTRDQTFHGWWQQSANLLRSMVAVPPPMPPILLRAC